MPLREVTPNGSGRGALDALKIILFPFVYLGHTSPRHIISLDATHRFQRWGCGVTAGRSRLAFWRGEDGGLALASGPPGWIERDIRATIKLLTA